MIYTIQNEHLQVSVSSYGAELQSIKSTSGCEYLWQGDPKYWGEKAPVLFPFIARLQDKKYHCNGKEYPMELHGFAKRSEFICTASESNRVTLTLTDTPESHECYPYAFKLHMTYRLEGNTIHVEQLVENLSEDVMHFALGGHPGFRAPLEEGESFSDYYLEFSQACTPDLIGFTADTVLLNGVNRQYPLVDGTRIPLCHQLFDGDALIMQNAARRVSLKNKANTHTVTVAYPQMAYIGFWKRDHSDAPYICIEPWSSLPGRAGLTEEISCRSDFIHLAPCSAYENNWTITVEEA